MYEFEEEVFRVLDVISLGEMLDRIVPQLPGISESTLASGLRRYLSGEDSLSYVFYSRSQALKEAERLIRGFVEECKLPVSSEGFVEEETFAGKVARETGLSLIGEPAAIYYYRSIDGRW